MKDGSSWWSVHRSVLIKDDDERYLEVLGLIGDGRLLNRAIIEDDSMMFGKAEWSRYEVTI
jgi:hypothetical protein